MFAFYIACDLVFLCVFYARLSTYVHDISKRCANKMPSFLFMNSLGATVQAICTSNGTKKRNFSFSEDDNHHEKNVNRECLGSSCKFDDKLSNGV